MLAAVTEGKLLSDRGTARIEQIAFADFVARGELDRHLRRMRVSYRARRDALVAALADELPEATVRGIAAGLHATVELPASDDKRAILEHAHRRRIDLCTMADYGIAPGAGPATLLLGYGQTPEPAIRTAVHEVAEAVRAARLDGE